MVSAWRALVAVREPVEGGLGRFVLGQRLCKLGRDLHRAGCVVQLDVDIDHVTAADPRASRCSALTPTIYLPPITAMVLP
jgi:hypothetical protein